jgi:hypothetical protein
MDATTSVKKPRYILGNRKKKLDSFYYYYCYIQPLIVFSIAQNKTPFHRNLANIYNVHVGSAYFFFYDLLDSKVYFLNSIKSCSAGDRVLQILFARVVSTLLCHRGE